MFKTAHGGALASEACAPGRNRGCTRGLGENEGHGETSTSGDRMGKHGFLL